MHYVEFQTRKIKFNHDNQPKNLSLCEATQLFIHTKSLFKQSKEGEYHLTISWPHPDGMRDIDIIASENASDAEESYTFDFHYNHAKFLTITVNGNELDISRTPSTNRRLWPKDDLNDLADNFTSSFCDNIASPSSYSKKLVLTKNEFEQRSLELAPHNLSYKIDHLILENGIKRDNTHRLYFNWIDAAQRTHRLRATFSSSDSFFPPKGSASGYSWVLTENQLLKFPEYAGYKVAAGQFYYSLIIDERFICHGQSGNYSTQVLDLWFSSDGEYGELRNLHKGANMSGNDVLDLYHSFDELFQIKKTFICDESHLERAVAGNATPEWIPLRLFSAITSGKTWYESKIPGVTLFDCQQFQTSHNGKITQNSQTRREALQALQTLKLADWHAMLSFENQLLLTRLYTGHILQTRRSARLLKSSIFGETTLKELTTLIFDASKRIGAATEDLMNLKHLLCDGTYANDKLDPGAKDYWLKIKVKELVENSTFWIKRRNAEQPIVAETPTKKLSH